MEERERQQHDLSDCSAASDKWGLNLPAASARLLGNQTEWIFLNFLPDPAQLSFLITSAFDYNGG